MVRAGEEALPEADGTMLVQPGEEKSSGVPNSSLLTPTGRLLRRQGQALHYGVWQDSWSQAVEPK